MVLFIYFLILFIYLATPGIGCGTWSSLQHVGHLVESCELLVAACGIQFPNQGLNLDTCVGSTVLATYPPGKSSEWHFRKSLMAAGYGMEWRTRSGGRMLVGELPQGLGGARHLGQGSNNGVERPGPSSVLPLWGELHVFSLKSSSLCRFYCDCFFGSAVAMRGITCPPETSSNILPQQQALEES